MAIPTRPGFVLRNLVNASVGFEALAAETKMPSKSLRRMLSDRGIFGAVRKRLESPFAPIRYGPPEACGFSRQTLGIKHLQAILRMSMGGMNAWQWAELYPRMMDGVMPVVSLPITISGRNLLWRRLVVDSIRSDPDWLDGNYLSAAWHRIRVRAG
jgi:hypothetical protein